MCLGMPMTIKEVRENGTGIVELEGTRYDVDFSLIADPKVGDFVIVHAGFAIERLDPEEADSRLEMFAEIAEMNEDGDATSE